jgi:cell division transport system permease protein
MTPRSFLYLAREGFVSVIRHPPLTLAAIVSIAASLLVLGIVLLFTSNVERHARATESRRVMDIYVIDNITPAQRAEIEILLATFQSVARTRYVSKDEALEAFQLDVGRHDLIEALGYNPLPASFRLEMVEGKATGAQMRSIAEELAGLAGVEDVRFGGDWIERLDAALFTLRLADIVAAILVGLAVAFAVNSTIRLTALARREMIEIMTAVGATPTYVRTPFLVEGLIQSLVAAGATLIVLKIAVSLLAERMGGPAVRFLGPWEMAGFLGFAAALGLIGALWSVRFVLRRSA